MTEIFFEVPWTEPFPTKNDISPISKLEHICGYSLEVPHWVYLEVYTALPCKHVSC